MMRIFKKSDVGLVRSCNQDAAASGIFGDGTVWAVVCDGMGGANGGEYASAKAAEIISVAMETGYSSDMGGNAIRELLSTAIRQANASVFERSQSDFSLYGMGTTVVAAVVKDGYVITAYAGDSRAYSICGGCIHQLTTDHSVVQEMVDLGKITAAEARNHPRKNIITRALGVDNYLDIDFSESKFEQGGLVLLCSDGLTNCVEDAELVSIAANTKLESLPEAYIAAACANGGSDNITALIICE